MIERIKYFVENGDRYIFDFDLCRGWPQMDTTSDAWYYGNWCNPFRLQIVNYTEGDVSVTTYDTEEQFRAAVEYWVRWAKQMNMFKGIDPGLNEEMITKMKEVGLGVYLY